MIFVFGSNLAGRHGRGAALHAKQNHGAKYGVGVGRTGNAYALPTKDFYIKTLPLDIIQGHVNDFIQYAKDNKTLQFEVTRVGCGLAGYKDEDIAPFFVNSPTNCHLPVEWESIITTLRHQQQFPSEHTSEFDKGP